MFRLFLSAIVFFEVFRNVRQSLATHLLIGTHIKI
jgi:hypothetical protein